MVIGSRIPICNCYSSEHEISSKHGSWQRPCNQRATTTVTAETAYGHRGCGRFFLHDLLACFYSLLIQLYFLLDRGKRCPSAVVTCSKLVFLNSKLVVFVASPPPLEFPQEILREGVDAAAWATTRRALRTRSSYICTSSWTLANDAAPHETKDVAASMRLFSLNDSSSI